MLAVRTGRTKDYITSEFLEFSLDLNRSQLPFLNLGRDKQRTIPCDPYEKRFIIHNVQQLNFAPQYMQLGHLRRFVSDTPCYVSSIPGESIVTVSTMQLPSYNPKRRYVGNHSFNVHMEYEQLSFGDEIAHCSNYIHLQCDATFNREHMPRETCFSFITLTPLAKNEIMLLPAYECYVWDLFVCHKQSLKFGEIRIIYTPHDNTVYMRTFDAMPMNIFHDCANELATLFCDGYWDKGRSTFNFVNGTLETVWMYNKSIRSLENIDIYDEYKNIFRFFHVILKAAVAKTFKVTLSIHTPDLYNAEDYSEETEVKFLIESRTRSQRLIPFPGRMHTVYVVGDSKAAFYDILSDIENRQKQHQQLQQQQYDHRHQHQKTKKKKYTSLSPQL